MSIRSENLFFTTETLRHTDRKKKQTAEDAEELTLERVGICLVRIPMSGTSTLERTNTSRSCAVKRERLASMTASSTTGMIPDYLIHKFQGARWQSRAISGSARWHSSTT